MELGMRDKHYLRVHLRGAANRMESDLADLPAIVNTKWVDARKVEIATLRRLSEAFKHTDEATAMLDGLDDFERAYLDCALWLYEPMPASGEWCDHNDRESQVGVGMLVRLKLDCEDFRADPRTAELIADHETQAGHDFWLTRNGHGAGFWDRGDLYGDKAAGEYLSDRASGFGECDVIGGCDDPDCVGEGCEACGAYEGELDLFPC